METSDSLLKIFMISSLQDPTYQATMRAARTAAVLAFRKEVSYVIGPTIISNTAVEQIRMRKGMHFAHVLSVQRRCVEIIVE